MNIFITGATGFLGGELLVTLSKNKNINKIYCLVRAKSSDNAYERIAHVMNYHQDMFDREKIIPVIGNLLDDDLPNQLINNKSLQDINIIVHAAANTSFSKIYDTIVENTNINGLMRILTWAKKLKHLELFTYIGTATICGQKSFQNPIKEDESPNPDTRHIVKYTFTKMRGEMLLHNNLPDDKILIIRPSIIMGDSRMVKPRSPVILWALAAINQLRMVPVNPDSKIDIIPVDYVANGIQQLLFAKRNFQIYHVSSGEESCTTPVKLCKVVSKFFNDFPDFIFVDKSALNQMKLWSKNKNDKNSILNDYEQYPEHWIKMFGKPENLRIVMAGLLPYFDFIDMSYVFDNNRILKDTTLGKSTPAHEYIVNCISYLKKINVMEGALDP